MQESSDRSGRGFQKSAHSAILDIVRVLGMFFVMLIHSPVGTASDSTPIIFLKGFVGGGAVPLFFILSGYLGANKIESVSVTPRQYFEEKWRTLVVPFLFWNTAVLSLVFVAKYVAVHGV